MHLFETHMGKIQENKDDSATSEEEEHIQQASVGHHNFKTSQTTAFVRFKKNSYNKLNNHGSYRPLSRRREMANGNRFISQEYNMIHMSTNFEDERQEFKESTHPELQELEDSMENGCHEDELGARDLYKDYQHNPVLECVNQILLHDQEEMETTAYQQENVCKPDFKGTGRFNYCCHSIKEEQDEESCAEGAEEEGFSQVVESQSNHHGDKHSSSDTQNCMQNKKEPLKLPVKDKTPSPPAKAQLLEEKACLLMASQRLTLVRNLEFEELDTKDTLNESPCPPQEKAEFRVGRSQVPPALPPKPPQLGAKGLCKKTVNNAQLNQNNHQNRSSVSSTGQDQKTCSKYGNEQSQDVNQNQHDIPECENTTEHSVKPTLHHDTRIPSTIHHAEKPRQRQILSNGSLKLALNQDLSQQLLSNSHDQQQEKSTKFSIISPSFEEKLDNLNISDFQNNCNVLKRQVKDRGSVTIVKSNNQLDGLTPNRRDREHTPRKDGTVHKHISLLQGSMETSPVINNSNNHCGKIRVGSSVSSLITGSSGNSIISELTKGEPEGALVLPRVSQMVRRFEDLGTGIGRESPQDDNYEEEEEGNNALRCNFEEFKLEDVDMDSVGSGEDEGRPAGDGAETRAAVLQNGNSGGNYENFLEATGLSQKSILTPSRLYSSHKNVRKPKDVKHRNRVLKAAAVNGRSGGPVVKYWVEPFL